MNGKKIKLRYFYASDSLFQKQASLQGEFVPIFPEKQQSIFYVKAKCLSSGGCFKGSKQKRYTVS